MPTLIFMLWKKSRSRKYQYWKSSANIAKFLSWVTSKLKTNMLHRRQSTLPLVNFECIEWVFFLLVWIGISRLQKFFNRNHKSMELEVNFNFAKSFVWLLMKTFNYASFTSPQNVFFVETYWCQIKWFHVKVVRWVL